MKAFSSEHVSLLTLRQLRSLLKLAERNERKARIEAILWEHVLEAVKGELYLRGKL